MVAMSGSMSASQPVVFAVPACDIQTRRHLPVMYMYTGHTLVYSAGVCVYFSPSLSASLCDDGVPYREGCAHPCTEIHTTYKYVHVW